MLNFIIIVLIAIVIHYNIVRSGFNLGKTIKLIKNSRKDTKDKNE